MAHSTKDCLIDMLSAISLANQTVWNGYLIVLLT
jgi:hypothetical protein